MTKTFSSYLDLVRFYAAFCVFIQHLAGRPFIENALLWRTADYTANVVPIFFVLSGYVIAHVIKLREHSAREYLEKRISRIYSVVLIALVLTWILDSIGTVINPILYSHSNVLLKDSGYAGYLFTLLLLNEYQVLNLGGIAPGTNGPLWSLSFEMTYYAVAGLIIFATKWWKFPAAVLVLALGGRTIVAMAPFWAAGFILYRAKNKLIFPLWLATPVFLSSLFFILKVGSFTEPWDKNFGEFFPWSIGPFNRMLLNDYATTILFIINLTAAKNIFHDGFPASKKMHQVAAKLGSLTFTLYCIHFPIICFLAAVSPFSKSSWAHVAFIILIVMACTLIIAPLTDIFKNFLKNRLGNIGLKLQKNPVSMGG